ncbi:unnamed protein product [Diabrotica balteata]|uniref:Ionotropic receptor n=1 Tax=Diabrotica balteata TaxID=107213 RepID=A0A9N9T6P2_DIABA|nr:unnamed protein product [Diabrotica balteata]
MLPNPQCNSSFNIYSESPYFISTRQTYLSVICRDGIFFQAKELSHIPKRKSKWTVRVIYFPRAPFTITSNNTLNHDRPGLEVQLLNSFAKYINVQMTYTPTKLNHSRGHCYVNGILTNEFKDLYKNRYDVLIGGYTAYYERMLYFSISFPIYQDSLIWCVPNKAVFVYTVAVNNMIVTLVLLTLFLLIILTWLVNRQKFTIIKYRESFGDIVYDAFIIFLGVVVPRVPKKSLLRFLIGLMILFAFLSNIMFTSSVISSFIGIIHRQKYGCMKDIYENNLTTYFVKDFASFFVNKNIEDVPLEEVKAKYKECEDLSQCLQYVESGTSSLFLDRAMFDYIVKFENIDASKIYCFNYVKGITISMISRKGFFLTEQYDRFIHLYNDFGLIQKLTNNVMERKKKYRHKLKFAKLKLTDLASLTYVLFYGYLSSIIVCIAELFYYKCKRYWN